MNSSSQQLIVDLDNFQSPNHLSIHYNNSLQFYFRLYIFLFYNHSKQEMNHSFQQQLYLYQVILSNSSLVYIFLIYSRSKPEINHSLKQQVYLYQVILSNSTLLYIFLIYNHLKQGEHHSMM